MESDSSNAITWIFVLEKVRRLVCQKKAQGYSKILPFKFGLLSRSQGQHRMKPLHILSHSFIYSSSPSKESLITDIPSVLRVFQ